MNIEIVFDTETETYSVDVNGKTVLECLSADEVQNLTIKELDKFYINIYG